MESNKIFDNIFLYLLTLSLRDICSLNGLNKLPISTPKYMQSFFLIPIFLRFFTKNSSKFDFKSLIFAFFISYYLNFLSIYFLK